MKTKTLRAVIPVAVGVVVAIAFAAHIDIGAPSGFGWGDIALLCPLGALAAMVASKTLIPRAVIALVIAIVLILIFGRAFCGWVCPIPVTRKIPSLFKGKKKAPAASKAMDISAAGKGSSESLAAKPHGANPEEALNEAVPGEACELADDAFEASVKASVKRNLHANCDSKTGCVACADLKAKIDSRHFVLAGGLLSAAIFGFPVFCLVCPIGLSFATLFLVVALFGTGDLTWALIAVPALLVLELVVFRKWCSKICPLSALMSLIGLMNGKTLRPTVDADKCIEKHGAKCGKCHEVCEVSIDPRHPELGANFNECLKCRACVEACPGKAIEMPFLPKKQ